MKLIFILIFTCSIKVAFGQAQFGAGNGSINSIPEVAINKKNLTIIDSFSNNSKLYNIYAKLLARHVTLPSDDGISSTFSFGKLYAIKDLENIDSIQTQLDPIPYNSTYHANTFYTTYKGNIEKIFEYKKGTTITGLNLNTGKTSFSFEDPFTQWSDDKKRFLYADALIAFVLIDSTGSQIGHNLLVEQWYKIYRYDFKKKNIVLIYTTGKINSDYHLTSQLQYFINKVSDKLFLFAYSSPTVQNTGTITVNSNIICFESVDGLGAFTKGLAIMSSQPNSYLYLVQDSYYKFLFRIKPCTGLKTDFNLETYPGNDDFISIEPNSLNIKWYIGNRGLANLSYLDVVGNLFVCNNGGIYLTDNINDQRFLIDNDDWSGVIYLSHKKKYYLIRKGADKIYIYQINIENIFQ